MPYLGIDGGGSKTAFALVDDRGRTLGAYEGATTNYNQIGFAGVEAVLSDGLARVFQQAGLAPAQITGAVVGIGGVGEIAEDMPPLIASVGAALGTPEAQPAVIAKTVRSETARHRVRPIIAR